MGLKFDLMFRLGIAGASSMACCRDAADEGREGLRRGSPGVAAAPGDGTPVEKASYAYPEVREFMLSMIAEATERFDVDGVSLGFIRGPQYMQYEEPVLQDFRERFGEDGTKVGFGDPRMRQVRCAYLTRFVRDRCAARSTASGVRRAGGSRSRPGCYPDVGTNLNYGLDVVEWMESGYHQHRDCPGHGRRADGSGPGQRGPLPASRGDDGRSARLDQRAAGGRGRLRAVGHRRRPATRRCSGPS